MRSSWSVLRAKADAWMAEKMEEAGIFVMPGIKIDQLHIEGLDHQSYSARDLTDPAEDSGTGAAQKWESRQPPEGFSRQDSQWSSSRNCPRWRSDDQ